MLVIDASAAITAASSPGGFLRLAGDQLIAPPLLWSEATSAIRENLFRGAISAELAARSLQELWQAPIEPRRPAALYRNAWEIATRLGWAKTYDAEYIALARIEECRLLTLDARLRRGAAHLVRIVGPTEL